MTCGQSMEKKIVIGRLDSGSYGPKLANQSDCGNVVKYGNLGPMCACTTVSSTSELDGDIYIHNSSILW